jgi:hypothetical protein
LSNLPALRKISIVFDIFYLARNVAAYKLSTELLVDLE